MTVAKLDHIRSAVKAVSTPTNDADGSNGQSLTESIADFRTPLPEDALFNESEAAKIARLLGDLEDRESKILRMRYGLDGEAPMTLKEIGVAIHLTRERVRQIEGEALAKIKQHIIGDE